MNEAPQPQPITTETEQPPRPVDVGDPELNQFLSERNARYLSIKQEDKRGVEEVIAYDLHQPASGLEPLPQGYCYMGGAARNTVLESFGEEVAPPRDIDLVGISDWNPDPEHKTPLSKKYMADDVSIDTNYGVKIESATEYFADRDFTMNEVLTDGTTVWATANALRDLASKTVRLSETQQVFLDKNHGSGKLVMKALRLFLQWKDTYKGAHLEDLDQLHFANDQLVDPFDIILQLDKAGSNGDPILEEFADIALQLCSITTDTVSETSIISGYPNASRVALALRGKYGDFRFKSPVMQAILGEVLAHEAITRSYENATMLADRSLHRIRHLENWRKEVA